MAGTTWGLTRENLINQREASATRQAQVNASEISPNVDAEATDTQLQSHRGSAQTRPRYDDLRD